MSGNARSEDIESAFHRKADIARRSRKVRSGPKVDIADARKSARFLFTLLHCHFLSRGSLPARRNLASDTGGSARGLDDFRVAHGAATLRRGSFSDIP
jgi:hypothetical protein